jgi:predicted hotdog family 3-hydroxylacyl-ACP dehydratase
MQLDRRWIESHIPHHGTMCLLEEVLSWDMTRTSCRATSHRSSDNPLRAFGRLGAVCGIEYAAQTMAVHGALIASSTGTAAPRGFLASVRNIDLHAERLDDVASDLVASVEHITGDERTVMYEFAVSSREQILLSGRAAVVFDL